MRYPVECRKLIKSGDRTNSSHLNQNYPISSVSPATYIRNDHTLDNHTCTERLSAQDQQNVSFIQKMFEKNNEAIAVQN